MEKHNINLNVEIDVDDLIGEPIRAISKTVASCWDIVFGGIEIYSEKKRIERQRNLELYKRDFYLQLEDIPEEKLQEPSVAIIGPALKASEFFFEEAHYRKMFSRIIAGACNSDYNGIMHPAYANIITELSKNDALTLRYLYSLRDNSKSLVARKLEVLNLRGIPKDSLYPNSIATRKAFSHLSPLGISLSLSNLQRLNLITITDSVYGVYETMNNDQFQNVPLVQEFRNKYPNNKFKLLPMQINLTTLGKSFSRICL